MPKIDITMVACPSCGEEDEIQHNHSYVDGNMVAQVLECLNCGELWEDRYVLVSSEPIVRN